MAIDETKKLTPTEALILEVLVSRYRMGEVLWTFSSNVKSQVESLSKKGYVIPMGGQVEYTVRAALTDEAVAQCLSYDYVPPIAKGNDEFTSAFKRVTEKAQALRDKFKLGS